MLLLLNPTVRLILNTCSSSVDRSTCPVSFHSSIIITAVYVPPDATAKLAMKELCSAVNKLQTVHPDGAFIIAGDFNHANLRSVLPKFYQNVSCPTRGANTLDNV